MTRHTLLKVPIEKNVVREVTVGDSIIRGALGPLDFPELLRVSCGEDEPIKISIDFVYPMAIEEPTEERRVEDGALRIGKDTGRVLQISVATPKGAKGLRLIAEVEPALEELTADARIRLPRDNRLPRRLAHYSMVEDLLPWIAQQLVNLRREGPTLVLP